MMSVLEYALDVSRAVEEILKKCQELNIDASNEEDMLDEEAITELDNVIANESYEEDIDEMEDELIEKEKNKIEEISNNKACQCEDELTRKNILNDINELFIKYVK